jgi:hypothetical protein
MQCEARIARGNDDGNFNDQPRNEAEMLIQHEGQSACNSLDHSDRRYARIGTRRLPLFAQQIGAEQDEGPPSLRSLRQPIQMIGRNSMPPNSRGDGLPGGIAFLDDLQFAFRYPASPPAVTDHRGNLPKLVRNKLILKPVLEPSCLCRLPGRKWGQFT